MSVLLIKAVALGMVLLGSWLILEAVVEMDRPRKRKRGDR